MNLLSGSRLRQVAHSVIRDPAEHTVMDEHGAVRSTQAAEISLPAADLEAIWTPMYLERLARTYWRYLSRVTLGLIRVVYTPTERVVVLHRAPARAAAVPRARVRDGRRPRCRALADPRRPPRRVEGHEGDGYLEIEVRRLAPQAPDTARPRGGRDRLVLSRDRAPDRALVLQEHPVAHPCARDARLPPLAGAASWRSRRSAASEARSRRSPSATRRGRSSARCSPRSRCRAALPDQPPA